MKNIKIFPKICIQTFSIIAIIVLFMHLLVYIIFPKTYLESRKDEMNHKANEITENMEGKDLDYVTKALAFYSDTSEIKAYIKKDSSNNEVEIQKNVKVDRDSDSNSLIIEERTLSLEDGTSIVVQFVSTANMQKQAKNLSLQFLPYSLFVSLLFSALVSLAYAKSIRNHVLEIKNETDKMMTLDKNAYLKIDSNDEIGELKEQINDLYLTLLKSIDDLEVKNKEIIKLEKIKYDVFRGASHELKTPLASLKIILENMKYNIGKYKNRDMYIEESIHIVDQLNQNISQILSIYSIENLKDDEEELCIKDCLEIVLNKYDVLIHQKQLSISNKLENETIYIGKSALDMILSNLVSNAIKYSNISNTIDIGVEDNWLYIKNTYSQDSLESGNGLGLYIVRNLLNNYKIPYEVLDTENQFSFRIQIYSK